MQTDPLRAAARAIYDACFPTDEVAPVGFDDAEKFETVHYRRALVAAQGARLHLLDEPTLFF
jgi:hypothetical protein